MAFVDSETNSYQSSSNLVIGAARLGEYFAFSTLGGNREPTVGGISARADAIGQLPAAWLAADWIPGNDGSPSQSWRGTTTDACAASHRRSYCRDRGVVRGGGGSSTQVVHGQVLGATQAAAITYSALGGVHGICGGAVEGTQVIVKGPSGTLLATTTLHKDSKATSALNVPSSLSSGQLGIYDFSTTIPAGTGPYTIELVGISSLVVSANQLHDLQLSC
jgi:hypothetical protein